MFSSKHARLSVPRARTSASTDADSTRPIGEDIINLVATFASCRDLCTLSFVCRRFRPVASQDDQWELRALDILPSRDQLLSAMAELQLTSFRQLVEALTRIGIPGGALGFWRAEVPAKSWAAQLELSSRLFSSPEGQARAAEEIDMRGELLRISLAARGFLCESIASDGTSRTVFTARISVTAHQKVKVGFFCSEDDSAATMGGDSWCPGRTIGEAFLDHATVVPSAADRTPIRPAGNNAFFFTRDGTQTRFTKLQAPPPPFDRMAVAAHSRGDPNYPAAAAAVAVNLCGLWCAPYGSHEMEIVQISVGSDAAAAQEVPGVPARAAKASGRFTGSTCSSSKTSRSESVCTSAPATDSSEGGFGGSCSSNESDEEDEVERKTSSIEPKAATKATTTASAAPRNDAQSAAVFGVEAAELGDDEDQIMSGGADTDQAGYAGLLPLSLFGVKVTGDANVPAGKTSFAIDLDKDFDIGEELEADRRPVILFLPTGAVMANLANRRGNIAFWRKGRGQINRVPGRWAPEWVDVDFVAYQPGSRCAFSVVFRQPAQAVRVIMDFERVLGAKEEWPQWPADVSPAASAAL